MTTSATSGMGTKLQREDSGAGAVAATLSLGAGDAVLVTTAKALGTGGNSKTVTIVEAGVSTLLSVGLIGDDLTINLATDGGGTGTSTVNDVIAALVADTTINATFTFSGGAGLGTGLLLAAAMTSLATGADGSTAFVTVAEVKNFSQSLSADTVDATSMDNIENHREHVVTVKDGGEISFEANFLPGDTVSQQKVLGDYDQRATTTYKIIFTDAGLTEWTAPCAVTQFQVQGSFDALLTVSVTLKVMGPPSLVTA